MLSLNSTSEADPAADILAQAQCTSTYAFIQIRIGPGLESGSIHSLMRLATNFLVWTAYQIFQIHIIPAFSLNS